MAPLILKKPPYLSNKKKIPGLAHPTPFIDKLSVTLNMPSQQYASELHTNIWPHLNSDEFLSSAKANAPYKYGRRIKLDCVTDEKRYPLLQYSHYDGQAARFRVEFVPVDLSVVGLTDLHNKLGIIGLPQGWGSMIVHGTITRIDIAIDFPSKQMPDFLFLPKKGATVTTWKSNGDLQTFQSGKPSGNVTQIYDRKAKRIAKGSSWKGKEGIRVERRLKTPSITLPELSALPNPFADIKLVKALGTSPPPNEKPWIWRLFLSAVDQRGLSTALALLPEDKVTTYRTHYAASQLAWWSPDGIWANWRPMLAELGLGDFSKYN